jgi:hypothetical protein
VKNWAIDPMLQKGVYQIPCVCRKKYVREIGRPIQTIIKENSVNIQFNRTCKSTLAKHSHNTKHPIKIKEMKILVKLDNWSKKRIKEEIKTIKNSNFFN